MSTLLIVAIVLLILVVGLTLMQRRAVVQPQAPRRPAAGKTVSPPSPSEPPEVSSRIVVRSDPLLGEISLYKGVWTAENDLDLHGTRVLVEIDGTIDGPNDADREFVTAALARPDLDQRARAMVLPELQRRNVETSGVVVYELAVRPDDTGIRTGFLWYEVPSFDGLIGVRSVDHWRTITLQVDE